LRYNANKSSKFAIVLIEFIKDIIVLIIIIIIIIIILQW